MTTIVQVESAGFTYTIRHGGATTLKDAAMNSIRRISSDVKVNALSDVSFTIESGEVLTRGQRARSLGTQEGVRGSVR